MSSLGVVPSDPAEEYNSFRTYPVLSLQDSWHSPVARRLKEELTSWNEFAADNPDEAQPASPVATAEICRLGEEIEYIVLATPSNHCRSSKDYCISWWDGTWGGYGDSLFCGLNCGYAWAVRTLKKLKQWGEEA